MITNPETIENRSFEIISSELDTEIDEEIAPIVKRIIHTTADFEYADITEIHRDAVRSGISALRRGCKIYADTNMIFSGVNKYRLKDLGSEIYTLVDDADIKKTASERGVTRSIVGMETAAKISGTGIFTVGNAPTALFTLKKLIDRGSVKPELVIGVPVGFVGASESKAEIAKSDIPYIITRGRKGGSTVAAAILNALIYMAG